MLILRMMTMMMKLVPMVNQRRKRVIRMRKKFRDVKRRKRKRRKRRRKLACSWARVTVTIRWVVLSGLSFKSRRPFPGNLSLSTQLFSVHLNNRSSAMPF
jgi:hypothetical protein